eukprot:5764599-Lingulodinium_polyedra.AAC.1
MATVSPRGATSRARAANGTGCRSLPARACTANLTRSNGSPFVAAVASPCRESWAPPASVAPSARVAPAPPAPGQGPIST